jgi:hypothetical protein
MLVIESDVPPNSTHVSVEYALLVDYDGILLDNSTDSSFFLLTPLDDTPYRRMGMSYQVEELVVITNISA